MADDVPSGFRQVDAQNFCLAVVDGTHASPKESVAGRRLVTSKHIKDGRLDLLSAYRISEADFEEINRRSRVHQWDVIFTMIGTVGESALVVDENPDFTIKNVGLFKSRDELSGRWLYYFLRTPQARAELEHRKKGSTQQYISLGDLRSFPVLVPIENYTTKWIVSILQAFDDRIDNLRQTNATLEAIAQALFKSWFVDFDPVRAKAEGREPEGMGAATAAQLPAKMEASEIGLIPEGWQAKPLDSIAKYTNGLALQKYPPESETEFLPVVKIAQLRAGHTVGADRASMNLKPDYVVEDGDVLFSWSGSLLVEQWCGGRGALNQHLFKVTSGEVPKWFYFLATRHHLPHFREVAANKATTMGHIQRRHLAEAFIALPSSTVLEEASKLFTPLLETWLHNAQKARLLQELRDTLLPRLISGKLRLPDAEREVEAAIA